MSTKTKPRSVDAFEIPAYQMPKDLKLAAKRAQFQPVLISVNSKIKPAFNGDNK